MVRNIAIRVAVMYLGKIVEMGPTKKVLMNPVQPYTQMLLASVPIILDEEKKLLPCDVIPIGEIPSAMDPPPGFRFHTRCPFARDECKKIEPTLVDIEPDIGQPTTSLLARRFRTSFP